MAGAVVTFGGVAIHNMNRNTCPHWTHIPVEVTPTQKVIIAHVYVLFLSLFLSLSLFQWRAKLEESNTGWNFNAVPEWATWRDDICTLIGSLSDFPRWLSGLRIHLQCMRNEGSIPGLGRSPGGGNGNPFQYSCLEKSHGQRSLAGYVPWGRRVGHDWVSKRARAHTHTHTHKLTMLVVSDTAFALFKGNDAHSVFWMPWNIHCQLHFPIY